MSMAKNNSLRNKSNFLLFLSSTSDESNYGFDV